MAKLSVSALLFDYVLTARSAPCRRPLHHRLIGECSPASGWRCPSPERARRLRDGVILYFWWRNLHGLHESSGDALKIIQLTTIMS